MNRNPYKLILNALRMRKPKIYETLEYITGSGIQSDGTEVKLDRIKIGIRTTGAAVMTTSVAWAFIGYLSLPKYSNKNGEVSVAALDAPLPTIRIDDANRTEASTDPKVIEAVESAFSKYLTKDLVTIHTGKEMADQYHWLNSHDSIYVQLRRPDDSGLTDVIRYLVKADKEALKLSPAEVAVIPDLDGIPRLKVPKANQVAGEAKEQKPWAKMRPV